VNGKIAPKSIVMEVADLIPLTGKAETQDAGMASVQRCFRGSYRQHAAKGFHGNKGDPSGSSLACKVRQADKVRTT